MSFGIQNISGKYMCVMSEREGKSEQMWTNLEYHAFMRRATVLIGIVAGTSHRVAPFGTGQEIDNDERLKKRYCPESEDRASLMLSTGQGANTVTITVLSYRCLRPHRCALILDAGSIGSLWWTTPRYAQCEIALVGSFTDFRQCNHFQTYAETSS